MDIEYLLALQNARESLGRGVELFMAGASFICDGPLLVAFGLIVYWCVHKRTGQLMILCMACSNFACQFLKNLVCAYRPWILDSRIVPASESIEGAAGYSFPSGHTSGVTSTFGTIAWARRHKGKAAVVACVAFILVVAFSRNYLGVHTPQDVVAGLVIAVAMICLVNLLFNWMDRCDREVPGHNRDVIVLVVTVALCACSVAVLELKAYPLDYVDGLLLVDPAVMKKGGFEGAGLMAGMALGWFCERRFVGFGTDAALALKERVARGVAGTASIAIVYVGAHAALTPVLPYLWAKLAAYFLLAFAAVFAVPLLFKPIARLCAK